MHRHWPVVAAIVLMVLACGRSQQDVANEFLNATMNQDLATLAEVSIVPLPFEIASWRITGSTLPRKEPFAHKEVRRKLSQARAARDAALAANDETKRLRIQTRVDRLRAELDEQREAARKSLRTWSPIDEFEGMVEVSEVEVEIRSPRGDDGSFFLTMKRFSLENSQTGARPPAEWILTKIGPMSSAY